jgi:hypothetical protein
MAPFQLVGIEKATMAKDRSRFDIIFRTMQGPLTLKVSAEHLGSLITHLQGLEYYASLLDPKSSQRPGQTAQVRAEIVERYEIGNTTLKGIPSVLLGLKSGQVFRWFAFDAQRALAAQRDLAAEIPKLQKEAGHH